MLLKESSMIWKRDIYQIFSPKEDGRQNGNTINLECWRRLHSPQRFSLFLWPFRKINQE